MDLSVYAATLTDYAAASSREWLATNGIGGYASASLAGANTRRYHGLLVAATEPPCGRHVALSRCEETVTAPHRSWDLSTNQYPGAIHPCGHELLERFDARPAPTFFFRLDARALLRKRVWMARGENTTYIEYALVEAESPVDLAIAPMVCWKSYHSEMRRRDGFPQAMLPRPDGVAVLLGTDAPALQLTLPGSVWRPYGTWYHSFEHERERERGFDWTEDLYRAGVFHVRLEPGASVALTATVEAALPASAAEAWDDMVRHGERVITMASAGDDMASALATAADAFVVDRAATAAAPRSTIIAGYPWFTDWGRDTMISLRGLCLDTGRHAIARDILMAYAGHVRDGLIPNRFPDGSAAPEYNTADATLWFIEAARAYAAAAPADPDAMRALWPTLTAIVARHLGGTRGGIGVDDADGLLAVGSADTQLTWMDARVDGRPVTPRGGKPVEINALWCSALRTMEAHAAAMGDDPAVFARLADLACRSFQQAFVRPDGLGLWDVIGPAGTPDPAIRPNQVIAAALPCGPLTEPVRRAVVEVAERELVTPRGLRTLAPGDPCYHGRYAGAAPARDGAYHQGTVWAWLLGPFVEAHLRVHGDRARARAFLEPMRAHLTEAGIGSVSEVFDGDAPHAPGGCVAQAWSVAELLRAWRMTEPE